MMLENHVVLPLCGNGEELKASEGSVCAGS